MDEVERRSREILDNLPRNLTLFIVGHPVGTGQIYQFAAPTFAYCSSCGIPIESDLIKDMILDLTKDTEYPVEIRCGGCLRMLVTPDL